MARFLPVLPLIGGGKTLFQPVFVGDVAAAIAIALDSESARARTYELGGPTVYSFRQILQVILAETGRSRVLLPVPFGIAAIKAFFLQFLPNPPLTPDQVKLLRHDNVVAPGTLGLADLGITPTTVEAEVPAYLWRYRPKGEYADMAKIG
jgi:NADH dehydrogenase